MLAFDQATKAELVVFVLRFFSFLERTYQRTLLCLCVEYNPLA